MGKGQGHGGSSSNDDVEEIVLCLRVISWRKEINMLSIEHPGLFRGKLS